MACFGKWSIWVSARTSRAELGSDQPLAPSERGHFDAVPRGHLGGIGLDLMPALLALNNVP
jgi:hypothetical protein